MSDFQISRRRASETVCVRGGAAFSERRSAARPPVEDVGGQTRAPSHAGHAARTRHYHRRRRRRRPRFPSVRPWKKCQERRIELSELGEKKKCVGSSDGSEGRSCGGVTGAKETKGME